MDKYFDETKTHAINSLNKKNLKWIIKNTTLTVEDIRVSFNDVIDEWCSMMNRVVSHDEENYKTQLAI